MKILLLDIETSPNVAHVWGLWNQNVGTSQIMDSGRTICWAAKWYGEDDVMFMSEYHDGHTNMLAGVYHLLDEADAVVHYNGTKFDIPTLNKEFLLKNWEPPAPYHQIDLLRVARKEFRFPSNKLDYVAQALGIGQKVKHIGHELWVLCLAKDAEAWKMMQEYNEQDAVLLESLYERLLPWIKSHPNHALYTDEERPVCPNCGSSHVISKGTETTKTMKYDRYRCKDCGTNIRGRTSILSVEQRKRILTQSKL